MAHSEFLAEARARGFLFQCTDEEGLQALLDSGSQKAYAGFDCTADSLHVGSLVQIMLLRLWQRHGNRPVIVLGGGTTRIGDPSGKDETRKMLTDEKIAENMQGIRKVFIPFLETETGPNRALFVNNADWLNKLDYIALLQDVGRYFTVNRMLTFDSVRLRLEREQPLTFLEFNYMILQSYDFRELADRENVLLQFGGSDQWGNIVSGIELIRKTKGKSAFGLTTPLITTASGAKMGKTAGGAVWLTADKRSPYDYMQFWRNTEDADVGRFLRLFTELPLPEIAKLELLQGQEINEAKKILAFEATRLAHGAKAAKEAEETARQTFEEGITSEGLPRFTLPPSALTEKLPAAKLLCLAGLTGSIGEARKLIRGGGVKLNDRTLEDETQDLTPALSPDKPLKISVGKKKHLLVEIG